VISYYPKEQEQDVHKTLQKIQHADGQTIGVFADVTKEDIKNLIQAADENFGRLDVMINNAGIENDILTAEIPLEDWNKVISTNHIKKSQKFGSFNVYTNSLVRMRSFFTRSANVSRSTTTCAFPSFTNITAGRGMRL
jgi:NAD(P)-dependent dehydrogenase (short-subunit alcohol dehydrogenase family)